MGLMRALSVTLIGGAVCTLLFASCSGTAPAARSADLVRAPETWQQASADQVDWRLGMLARREAGKGAILEWSASAASLAFQGTAVRIEVQGLSDSRWDECRENVLEVVVDGRDTLDHVVSNEDAPWLVIDSLRPGSHVVRLAKRTEALCGRVALGRVGVLGGTLSAAPPPAPRRILYLGGAVTCGDGVMGNDPQAGFDPGTQSGTSSYAAEAARSLGADFASVCVSGSTLMTRKAGESMGELRTFWRQGTVQSASLVQPATDPSPDAVVLELGHVESLDGGFDERAMTRAYVEFVMEIHKRWPKAWIVGMDVPALDDDQVDALRAILIPVDQWVRGRYKVANFSRLFLTQQGLLGYGGGGFPNRAQSAMNGGELADHLRERLGWGRVATK